MLKTLLFTNPTSFFFFFSTRPLNVQSQSYFLFCSVLSFGTCTLDASVCCRAWEQSISLRGLPYFRQYHNLLASSEVLTPIQYLPSPLSLSLTMLVSHNVASHLLTHLLHTGPNTNTSIIHYIQTPRLPLL